MNTQEETTDYVGMGEGGEHVDPLRQNDPPDAAMPDSSNGDAAGLMRIDDEESSLPSSSTYLWSADFCELGVCLVYALVAYISMYCLDAFVGPRERPIPYQYLENTGEYVVNLQYNESFEGETISFWALVGLSTILPLAAQVLLSLWNAERKRHDLHATACSYLVALTTNGVVTAALKLYVGYLRPIFYDECQPNDDYSACTDDHSDIRKSFPSGHASQAFCGLTLLTLFIHTRFGMAHPRYAPHLVRNARGDATPYLARETAGVGLARFVSILSLLPVALACFIATSRIVDNKHFPADVVTGSVLGATVATFVHGLWFG